MLKARVITAAVLLPLLLLAIWLLPTNYFAWIAGIVITIAAWEWGDLVHPGSDTLRLSSAIIFLIVSVIAFYIPLNLLPFFVAAPLWIMIFVWILLFQADISFLLHWRWLRFILGTIVLSTSYYALLFLHHLPHGPFWITYVLFVVFATDTGAYFSGRAFGKTHLISKVSPNKTWEGLLGGVLLSVIMAFVVAYLIPFVHPHMFIFVFISAIVSLVSIVGDLFESMLKRMVGIKDSGNILPGHGGILDRIDSILSALPIAALLIYLLF